MTMKTLLGAGLAMALALPGAALAHGTMGSGGPMDQGNSGSPPAAAQRIYHSLERAGFSQIHIRPHSFLVHARDQEGNPVAMVVSPQAVTAVTAVQPNGGQNSGQSGGNNG